MPRLPRLDLIGIPQHVVQRGNDRSPCFIGTADRQRAGRPGVQHESQRHAPRQRDDGKLLQLAQAGADAPRTLRRSRRRAQPSVRLHRVLQPAATAQRSRLPLARAVREDGGDLELICPINRGWLNVTPARLLPAHSSPRHPFGVISRITSACLLLTFLSIQILPGKKQKTSEVAKISRR